MSEIRVKICGVTRLEDARVAVDLGAWAIGFIFWPKSPRYIAPESASQIISKLSNEIRTVGVFVNPTVSEVKQAIRESGISTIQLHGRETLEFSQGFDLPVFKAFQPRSEQDLPRMVEFQSSPAIEAVLVDSFVTHQYGGTGKLADWSLAKKIAQTGPTILSGGLNSTNILAALQTVPAYAVDLASGVEERPGVKDFEKLRGFFEIIRSQKMEKTDNGME